jgi:hypothetical protein
VPLPYVIDPDAHVATVTLSGTVHGRQIAETMETMFRDPDWRPGFDVFWHGGQITQLLFEKDDLPGFVRVQREYAEAAGDGREIIFVARALDQAMAQMYTVMMRNERRKVHICQSEAEARDILGQHSPS